MEDPPQSIPEVRFQEMDDIIFHQIGDHAEGIGHICNQDLQLHDDVQPIPDNAPQGTTPITKKLHQGDTQEWDCH